MSRSLVLSLSLSLALVACGGGDAPSATPTATPTAGEVRTSAPPADRGTETGADATAAFLAAVEESLEGTDYAGLALADPEGFVATGEVMCDLLTEGATVDEVLTAYLAELDEARGGVQDDDAVLSGAVLGAATGSICPQHAGRLEEGT